MVKYRKIVMIIEIVHLIVLFDTIRTLSHRCTLKEIIVSIAYWEHLGNLLELWIGVDRGIG